MRRKNVIIVLNKLYFIFTRAKDERVLNPFLFNANLFFTLRNIRHNVFYKNFSLNKYFQQNVFNWCINKTQKYNRPKVSTS